MFQLGGEIHSSAHLFDPARLTLARELRGLTKSELSERVEKTPSSISQFESGRVRPDAQTLSRIALALGFPPRFFAKRGTANLAALDVCHFRSLRSASQKDRRQLLATASLLCELLGFLEQYVELPRERVTEVARKTSSPEEIEECAAAVRQRWGLGIGPIPDMQKLLEANGVVVLPIKSACWEVDAFSLWHSHRPVVCLVMDKGSTSRTRFDAAHELGHLVMHADALPGNPEIERQAHRFASAFLLPRESFLAECPRWLNWEHFRELKIRWRTSLAALIRRAYDLEILSEASYRRAFMHLNQTSQRMKEPDEPPEETPRLITKSLSLVEATWSLDRIAEALSIKGSDLRELVAHLSEPA